MDSEQKFWYCIFALHLHEKQGAFLFHKLYESGYLFIMQKKSSTQQLIADQENHLQQTLIQ